MTDGRKLLLKALACHWITAFAVMTGTSSRCDELSKFEWPQCRTSTGNNGHNPVRVSQTVLRFHAAICAMRKMSIYPFPTIWISRITRSVLRVATRQQKFFRFVPGTGQSRHTGTVYVLWMKHGIWLAQFSFLTPKSVFCELDLSQ